MKKGILIFALFLLAAGMFAAEPRKIEGAVWNMFLCGVEKPEEFEKVHQLGGKKIVKLALVSESGVNDRMIQDELNQTNSTMVYKNGTHDTLKYEHDLKQLRQVLAMTGELGIRLEIQIWTTTPEMNTVQCFANAGKEADIVLNYNSYWDRNYSRMIANAAEGNPNALYVLPYGEVGKPTGDAPQAFARKFDGSGVPNLLTAVPLSPNSKGEILHPTNRNEKDTQCIDFIVPAAHAEGKGVTCPAASSLAALACFVVAASDKKLTGSQIAELLFNCTEIPKKPMKRISNFQEEGLKQFESDLKFLTTPDNLGLRRLYAPGIPNVLKICKTIEQK